MNCPYCDSKPFSAHEDVKPFSFFEYECGTKLGKYPVRSPHCHKAEVNNLKERIKRLEDAGDVLAKTQTYDLLENVNWRKAKESKP